MAGIIYKIKNLITGKCYIGQSKHAHPSYRISAHMRTWSPLGRDLRDLGLKHFEVSVIDRASSKTELDEKEKKWVHHYMLSQAGCYNRTEGGPGTKGLDMRSREFSTEARRLMSEAAKAQWTDPLHRQRVSASSRQWWDNPDYRKRISEGNKRRWASMTPEQRKENGVKSWKSRRENVADQSTH